MTDRATFTYTGPEQHIRVGSETFVRHIATLTTDAEIIDEARKTADVEEETLAGNAKVAESVAEPEAAPATTPIAPAPTHGPTKSGHNKAAAKPKK